MSLPGKTHSIYMDGSTEEFMQLIRKYLKEELMLDCNESEVVAAALKCYWTVLK
jgi:hypothetical protein